MTSPVPALKSSQRPIPEGFCQAAPSHSSIIPWRIRERIFAAKGEIPSEAKCSKVEASSAQSLVASIGKANRVGEKVLTGSKLVSGASSAVAASASSAAVGAKASNPCMSSNTDLASALEGALKTPRVASKTHALPEIAFGVEKWQYYFGEVGEEPPLPSNMGKILKSKCPFWPGKRVEETHLLTLIPAQVNGRPFCLDLLGELVQRPRAGHATKYSYYWTRLEDYWGKQSPVRSYWALLTRDVLPGTLDELYVEQCAVLKQQSKGLRYGPPGALEVATAVLMEHVQSGKYLFGTEPWPYTRVWEMVDSTNEAVGGFGADGLRVGCGFSNFPNSGLAAVRRF